MAGERVLVIDDSLVYRDLLVNHILQPNGYVPLIASDGETGFQMARQEQPDLIILDMQMPGMTGLQVLEALYRIRNEIPIIMMTLHGSEDVAVQAFRLGARDYIIKPFDVEEMLAAIDRALAEVRLRRERDALTQTLEAERRQLEAVLTNTQDGILLVGEDRADHIILINQAACQIFGLKRPSRGQALADVIPNEILLDAFRKARQSDERIAQVEIPLDDGRTFNVNVTPIPGVGRVAVMQDITYLKELDRMKSEFVSIVSHDLRSPLTSVKGFADLLPAAGPLNEQQTYFLEKIRTGIDMVTTMVGDLLDLGRIEAEARLDMEPCSVKEIVEKAAASHISQAELKQQTMRIRVSPGLPPVRGNLLRLSQALTNLIGNAVKYTPEKGVIAVTAALAAESGEVAIKVSDNGIGIPEEDLPHIFEKFYRVERPESEGVIGSGLGLSIVKTIIEKHGGRIWVESQVGRGTTFTVVLPAIA